MTEEYPNVISEDEPVELLDGCLVLRMTKIPSHSKLVGRVRRKLDAILPPRWHVRIQDAITLPASEPEPDVAIARGDEDQYGQRHPGPDDLALVVEVADATLQRDWGIKKRVYASAGIPVYWIVDIEHRRLEVHSRPSGPGELPDFHERQIYGEDEEVPVGIEGREVGRVTVRDLLP